MMIYPELEISTQIDQEVQTSLQQLEEGTREEIQQELKRLREDKLLLENKVKGYLTLSDICLEYKQELRKLQQEYNKLLEKVCLKKEMKANHAPHEIESPAATTDFNLEYGHAKEQRTNNDDPGKTQLTSNNSSHIFRHTTSEILKISPDAEINTKELFDHVEDTPKSSEGSKSMPHDKNTDTAQRQNSSIPFRDKYPMQESIALEHILDKHSLSHDLSSSITGLRFENAPSDNIAMGQSARGMEENMKNGNFMNGDLIYSQIPDAHFEEMLHSGKLDSEKNPARLLANFKGVIEDLEKYQKINTVLLQKNNELHKIVRTNEENEKRFLARIRKLEHNLNELSMSRSSTQKEPADGWIHVENIMPSIGKQQEMIQNETQQSAVVTDEKELMQQKIRQLTEANQRWSHEWNSLQAHFESRINDLQKERDRVKLEFTDWKIGEEAKQRDYEKLLMVSKKKANDEENLKEEALVQLTSANNKVDALKNQISEMQSTISTLRREKQVLESERNSARQDQAGLCVSAPQISRHVSRSQSELQTEIEVLRQQLLVFQEDFERERQDRAKVISVKEDYKKQLETHKKRVQHLDKNIIALERQLKLAEDLNRQLQDDKDRIFQENTDLKNQLQREKENKYLICHQISNQPPVIKSQGLMQPKPYEYNLPMTPPQPIQYIISPGLYDQQRAHQIIGASQYVPVANAGSRNQPCLQPVSKQVELLPGAWSCNQCTFMNYPGRTVCEMCGYIQNTTENRHLNYTGNETLHARGDQQQQQYDQQQLRFQPVASNSFYQRKLPQEDTCG